MVPSAAVLALNLDLQIQLIKFLTWNSNHLQLLVVLKVLWRLLLSSVGC